VFLETDGDGDDQQRNRISLRSDLLLISVKHPNDCTYPTAPTNPLTSLFNPATAVAYPRRTSGPRAVLNMVDRWRSDRLCEWK
jgi:hypothetical protein